MLAAKFTTGPSGTRTRRRSGREVRVGLVDPDVEVGAVDDRLREEPQLDGRPKQLSTEPGLGQTRLGQADRDEVVGVGEERVGDGHERSGPRTGRRRGPRGAAAAARWSTCSSSSGVVSAMVAAAGAGVVVM
ncbi:hypothetical protein [Plantibacter sp. RU18]|uniref:hypothetical protein n=1 Tax=Plantibacter sp. RU18 TaxID=3158143 RepID=UPI003D36D882